MQLQAGDGARFPLLSGPAMSLQVASLHGGRWQPPFSHCGGMH
jgi:hypothetical protein